VLALPSYLTMIEADVISSMIIGQGEVGEIVANQLSSSSLESRDFNGHGFFTDITLNSEAQILPFDHHRFESYATVDDELFGFILWVQNGKVISLEGYPLGDHVFPVGKESGKVKITHVDPFD
jgi:hypothetical protein